MQNEYRITTIEFCKIHNIDEPFILALHEHELITIIDLDDEKYIREDDLALLEKIIRLHFELGINLEGIEAIHHLLQRVEQMQEQVVQLKNRLKRFDEF